MPTWYQLADQRDYAGAVIAYVRENQPATFPEVIDCLKDHLEVRGRKMLEIARGFNVALWSDISDELADLFLHLITNGHLYVYPCDPLLYLAVRKEMILPIVREIPRGPLIEPHWLPCILTADPLEQMSRVQINPELN